MNDLEIVRRKVAACMEDIMKNFKEGAKITVSVRRPDVPDHSQDFLMGNDDPKIVAEEIKGFFMTNYDTTPADNESPPS